MSHSECVCRAGARAGRLRVSACVLSSACLLLPHHLQDDDPFLPASQNWARHMFLQPPGSWLGGPWQGLGPGHDAVGRSSGAQTGLCPTVLPDPTHPPAHANHWGPKNPGGWSSCGCSGAGLHDLTVMVSYSPASRRRKQTLKKSPSAPRCLLRKTQGSRLWAACPAQEA